MSVFRRVMVFVVAPFLLIGFCGVMGMMTMMGALSSAEAERQADEAAACGQDDPEVKQYVGKTLTFKDLNAEQRKTATIIVTTGAQLRATDRDKAIAIAVAYIEGKLHNPQVPTDHDSIGAFQQRPSMGWGDKPAYKGDTRTPVQRLQDVSYSAARFYEKLFRIPNRPSVPFGRLAQKVQISAFPDRYARYEGLGNSVVVAARAQGVSASPVAATSAPVDCKAEQRKADASPGAVTGKVSALGWAWPAPGPAGSGYRSADRPSHAGVDIIAGRYATIVPASNGVVTKVKCNASTGNCDVDGGISVKGCGWYVEVTHGIAATAAGNVTVMTRYCHMSERPSVTVGQQVVGGKTKLGRIGSSGNSSGPHLHFEVRLNGTDTNPVKWEIAHGVTVPGYVT